jgi:hypothetical protein
VSAERDELALRKQLLIAQSGLYRAELQLGALSLRSRLSRGSSWITRGLTIFSVVRTVLSITSIFRR